VSDKFQKEEGAFITRESNIEERPQLILVGQRHALLTPCRIPQEEPADDIGSAKLSAL
jgi:hypothetical protein